MEKIELKTVEKYNQTKYSDQQVLYALDDIGYRSFDWKSKEEKIRISESILYNVIILQKCRKMTL